MSDSVLILVDSRIGFPYSPDSDDITDSLVLCEGLVGG